MYRFLRSILSRLLSQFSKQIFGEITMIKLDLSKTQLGTLVNRCTELAKLVVNASQPEIHIPAYATLTATELVHFANDKPDGGDVGAIWQ